MTLPIIMIPKIMQDGGVIQSTRPTPPQTIKHPWWVGRGDLPSKAGEAVLAAGGALLEDPPGIYYSYSQDMVSPSCGHYDCTILYPLYNFIDCTVL